MEETEFAFRGRKLGGWLSGIAVNGGGLMGCLELGMSFSGGLCSRLGLPLFLKLDAWYVLTLLYFIFLCSFL